MCKVLAKNFIPSGRAIKVKDMKFKGSVEINKPRSEAVRYFSDPEYLGEYQDGFVRKELIEGEQGQKGAISKMYYKYGKRDMELTETITSNRLLFLWTIKDDLKDGL